MEGAGGWRFVLFTSQSSYSFCSISMPVQSMDGHIRRRGCGPPSATDAQPSPACHLCNKNPYLLSEGHTKIDTDCFVLDETGRVTWRMASSCKLWGDKWWPEPTTGYLGHFIMAAPNSKFIMCSLSVPCLSGRRAARPRPTCTQHTSTAFTHNLLITSCWAFTQPADMN